MQPMTEYDRDLSLARVSTLLLLLLSACCPEAGDASVADWFPGVHGKLTTIESTCGGCGSDVKTSGWVRALRDGELVSEVYTDTGEFSLPLAPGDYDLEVAVDGARIDRTRTLKVGQNRGLLLRASYIADADPEYVEIYFGEDVAIDERAGILLGSGLVLGSWGDDSVPLAVRVDYRHIEVLVEALMAARPEVAGYNPAVGSCAD